LQWTTSKVPIPLGPGGLDEPLGTGHVGQPSARGRSWQAQLTYPARGPAEQSGGAVSGGGQGRRDGTAGGLRGPTLPFSGRGGLPQSRDFAQFNPRRQGRGDQRFTERKNKHAHRPATKNRAEGGTNEAVPSVPERKPAGPRPIDILMWRMGGMAKVTSAPETCRNRGLPDLQAARPGLWRGHGQLPPGRGERPTERSLAGRTGFIRRQGHLASLGWMGDSNGHSMQRVRGHPATIHAARGHTGGAVR